MRADYTCSVCGKLRAAQRRTPLGWILIHQEGGDAAILCGWDCVETYVKRYTAWPPVQNFLTTSEVAERLGVSPREVRQLAQRGRLRWRRVGDSSRALVFDSADVDAYQRDPRGRKPKARI